MSPILQQLAVAVPLVLLPAGCRVPPTAGGPSYAGGSVTHRHADPAASDLVRGLPTLNASAVGTESGRDHLLVVSGDFELSVSPSTDTLRGDVLMQLAYVGSTAAKYVELGSATCEWPVRVYKTPSELVVLGYDAQTDVLTDDWWVCFGGIVRAVSGNLACSHELRASVGGQEHAFALACRGASQGLVCAVEGGRHIPDAIAVGFQRGAAFRSAPSSDEPAKR